MNYLGFTSFALVLFACYMVVFRKMRFIAMFSLYFNTFLLQNKNYLVIVAPPFTQKI